MVKEDADETEDLAYLMVPAAGGYPSSWPVDAILASQIFWVFTDDNSLDHSITITANLTYYSYRTQEIESITTSVDLNIVHDAGSTRATARQVTPGNYLAYADDDTDQVDYYEMSVQSGKWINVLMTPPTGANFDLSLYDKYGNLLDTSSKSGDEIEHVYYQADYTGKYFIKIYAVTYRGLYTLNVKIEDTGPPGGCPFVFVWNGVEYLVDNNLLAASELSNRVDVEDYYRLEQLLVPKYQTGFHSLYSLQIREFENEHSYIDQVKLLAVDHDASVNVAATPSGEILTYENPDPPITAVDNNGNDLLSVLQAIDDQHHLGQPGNSIILDFGDLDINDGAKLVLRTDAVILPKSPCIRLQILNSTGDWTDITTIHPRVYWAIDIIDLSNDLPDPNGNLKIRLYFTDIHKIDYVGLDATPQAEVQTTYSYLISAIHSADTSVTTKLLHSDDTYAELLPNQQIDLTFLSLKSHPSTKRTLILHTEGHYYSITPENP
jgi:hypothetical protein